MSEGRPPWGGSARDPSVAPDRSADRARPADRAARLIAAALGQSMDRRRWRVVVAVRSRIGARRVRENLLTVLTAAVTAGVAYFVSRELLGHELPLFAPIAAWLVLGNSRERRLRRTAELGAGVTIGVWLGEVFVTVFGTGAVQIAVVLAVAALAATFLDRGQMLTTQAGVQSVVVVAMPAAMVGDGAFGRWSDALVGASLGLVVTALMPVDVVRRPRALARTALNQLAALLGTLAAGLRTGDAQLAADALTKGRASQPSLDAWSEAMLTARELVRVNPGLRGARPTVTELARAATLADRAMRNARVVSRRAVVAVEEDGPAPEVAAHVDAIAAAAVSLAAALGRGDPPDHARARLQDVAAALAPEDHADAGWRLQTLVSLLRSLAVDLLEITGMSHGEAVEELPEH